MNERDFYLLVRDMRDKQKKFMFNRDFFDSKQFKEKVEAEYAVDKALSEFTKKEQAELPFKD
jgi:hypothetical protein